MWVVLWVLVLLAVALTTGATAAEGTLDPVTAQVLRAIGWPGAALGVAWSPVGRALGAWLQARAGPPAGARGLPPEALGLLQEISQAVRQSAAEQREQTKLLQCLSRDLAVVLDRTRST